MKPLPTSFSELIRLGLQDLALCEIDDRYEIDFSLYHLQVYDKCRVCISGCVMAQTLEMPVDSNIHDISHKVTQNRLYALYLLSLGEVSNAFRKLGDKDPLTDLDTTITDYHFDPDRFKSDLATLSIKLRRLGF